VHSVAIIQVSINFSAGYSFIPLTQKFRVEEADSLRTSSDTQKVFVVPPERGLESADVGYQRIDHAASPTSLSACPTFHLFVPPSPSRNFGTSFLFCWRVLCYATQLHSLHLPA
jgi:hypothetical protein